VPPGFVVPAEPGLAAPVVPLPGEPAAPVLPEPAEPAEPLLALPAEPLELLPGVPEPPAEPVPPDAPVSPGVASLNATVVAIARRPTKDSEMFVTSTSPV
jgi:hypothetical protein